ncbi:glycosyltransferase 61 family protein [Alteromonas macleodii]|uniref:glycosyltransferase 61 family protein n=1 Tax=Alteromonas macleodii TaxID=28108 RepID=UPI001930AC95
MFSNAELIVGVHGSLFVNTIFANDTCKIIEYCPANRPDFSFQNKYKNAINYTHFLVDADSDFNIDIDLNELSLLL